MNIHELKNQDPKRFEREYDEWREHAAGYEWWDDVEMAFQERMKPLAVHVDRIYFSLGYCQSDYAAFEGRVFFHRWMENNGYAESHQMLYLDATQTCEYFSVGAMRDHARVNFDYYVGNAQPCGIFAELPVAAWDELVEEQLNSEDWHQLTQAWVDDVCGDLYRELRDEYEYLTSEEQFIEYCEFTDVTFTTDEE